MTSGNPSDRRSASQLAFDTTSQAQRLQIELWRRMSPLDKARAVSDATRVVQELSLAGIRQRHPDATERECRLRLALLTLGRPLASEVYPEVSSLSDT